ncbi:hypothetical protein [uncultured Mediterranean phage]|jgi:hypothetical protein|nr:hypothetical protein [uncultured Mediterranean phage]|tara:strand:- start:64 stop:264 length:201 start_codon:yes stop_codon:yes gene_type:complete
MFSMAIVSALSMYSCGIYNGMSMKPHKTTISTNTSVSSVDKSNSDKDQEKNSLGLTVKQEFIWKEQ